MQDCLALGAIFATTDSVAVLQVLEPDRAPLLFNLVFGEGVINDATTVALLRTIQALHLPLSALDTERVPSAHVVVLQKQHAIPNWKLVALPASLMLCLGKLQSSISSENTFALLGANVLSVLQRLGIEPKMDAATVGLIFGKFLYLFLASLVLGLVLGLFSALLLKKFNVSQTPQVMDALQ